MNAMAVVAHVIIAQMRSVQRRPTLLNSVFNMNGNTKPNPWKQSKETNQIVSVRQGDEGVCMGMAQGARRSAI